MRTLGRCRALFARQHGLILREQALEAGLTARQIDTLLEGGQWRALYRGIYADAAPPPTWERAVLAAVMNGGPNAVASGRCAATLHGFPGFHRESVEISSPTRLRNVPFTARLVLIPSGQRTQKRNIPVTTATRTLVDLAAASSAQALADALDDALRRNLTSFAHLRRLLRELHGRGKKGARVLTELIKDREDGRPIPESVLETRLWGPLKRLGAPAPVLQFPISYDGHDYRIDFAFPHAMVAVEAQSFRWHSDPTAQQRDMKKANAIQFAGWRGPIYVNWADMRDPKRAVFHSLRRMLLPSLFDGE